MADLLLTEATDSNTRGVVIMLRNQAHPRDFDKLCRYALDFERSNDEDDLVFYNDYLGEVIIDIVAAPAVMRLILAHTNTDQLCNNLAKIAQEGK